MGGIFLGGVHRLMQMWLVRRGLERRIPMFLLATAVLTTAAAMLFSRQSSGEQQVCHPHSAWVALLA